MSSRDMEPSPKLDSAQFFYQNPKLDYALSNCGQLLTDPKLDSLDFFIESSYKKADHYGRCFLFDRK